MKKKNIFECLDSIADSYGEWLSSYSFGDSFAQMILIYVALLGTIFMGFCVFNELGTLGGFALMYLCLIFLFTFYCKIFRWVVYD